MAHLRGGPCDGKNVGPALYGSTYCGGTKYVLLDDGDYHALASPLTGPGPQAAFTAWHNLNRELGRRTELALLKVERARSRMKRAIR